MKVVMLHSGGLDSTVLLGVLLDQGSEVFPLSINYGQRHARELDAAHASRQFYHDRHGDVLHPARIIDALGVFDCLYELGGGGALLHDGDVPEGHYADDSMRQTVVACRNLILLSFAAAYAHTVEADAVAVAVHAGDHAIYPDCRPEFVEAMRLAIGRAHYRHVMLRAPFLRLGKGAIVAAGDGIGAPFEHTWTCYKGGDVHCGKCGSCVERREAFANANVNDPVPYEKERDDA